MLLAPRYSLWRLVHYTSAIGFQGRFIGRDRLKYVYTAWSLDERDWWIAFWQWRRTCRVVVPRSRQGVSRPIHLSPLSVACPGMTRSNPNACWCTEVHWESLSVSLFFTERIMFINQKGLIWRGYAPRSRGARLLLRGRWEMYHVIPTSLVLETFIPESTYIKCLLTIP